MLYCRLDNLRDPGVQAGFQVFWETGGTPAARVQSVTLSSDVLTVTQTITQLDAGQRNLLVLWPAGLADGEPAPLWAGSAFSMTPPIRGAAGGLWRSAPRDPPVLFAHRFHLSSRLMRA